MDIWQRRDFVELCMNAEIGAYQQDTEEELGEPTFLGRDAETQPGQAEAAPRLASAHVA